MKRIFPRLFRGDSRGFSTVEILAAAVVFAVVAIGTTNAFIAIRKNYELARQLNEMYTVLSACPEIDRALEFNSLSDSANCAPNNQFGREDGYGGVRTYTPTLNVTSSTDPALVAAGDPLSNVPDSKIVDVKVGFQGKTRKAMELRMLITRNGVGQQRKALK